MTKTQQLNARLRRAENKRLRRPARPLQTAVAEGERDRPGRSRRRPADGPAARDGQPIGCAPGCGNVFGGTPKTASETLALPGTNRRLKITPAMQEDFLAIP